YHGETLAALAVGDVALYKETYKPLLMDVITVPSPDCYEREPGSSWEEHSRLMFEHMERALEQHHEEVAAVIVEPLIQCGVGMRIYHGMEVRLRREACRRSGVQLCYGEFGAVFGRSGRLFAWEQADMSPVCVCLSKALPGGYLPMSVCMTTD